MTFPVPEGQLDENEASYIMDACLKPKHRHDPKIIQFIESFVRCKNIAQASSEVGVKPNVGYTWRHRKDVANCITKLFDKSVVQYGFDASELVERVKEFVEVDPIVLENADGTFKTSLSQVPPEARRSIKKFKAKNLYSQTEDLNGMKSRIIVGQLIEVEFYDKLKSAELLGREKGKFKQTTKVEHDITEHMASTLLASKALADKMNNGPIEPELREAIEVPAKQFPKMESE